jgi:hypothetical protein
MLVLVRRCMLVRMGMRHALARQAAARLLDVVARRGGLGAALTDAAANVEVQQADAYAPPPCAVAQFGRRTAHEPTRRCALHGAAKRTAVRGERLG